MLADWRCSESDGGESDRDREMGSAEFLFCEAPRLRHQAGPRRVLLLPEPANSGAPRRHIVWDEGVFLRFCLVQIYRCFYTTDILSPKAVQLFCCCVVVLLYFIQYITLHIPYRVPVYTVFYLN